MTVHIDRYQVKTGKASGVVDDPKRLDARGRLPHYVLDLIVKVTTGSVETMCTVDALPSLRIVEC